MDDIDLVDLLMETDFTDDIERQYFLMVEAEQAQAANLNEYKKPEWWYIGMGLVEAPEAVRLKAKQIYKEFIRFKGYKQGMSFKELVESFTLAKAQNRTGV